MPKSTLYRVYEASIGYLVYRHCFDDRVCTIKDGALTHKTALFVTRSEAHDYCHYRNRLVDKHGDDALPQSADAGQSSP